MTNSGLRSSHFCQAEGIASIDLLTVPTVLFEQLYAFVVLTHARRTIVHMVVTDHPGALWLAHQVTEAFPWDSAPRFVIRDNDKKLGTAFNTLAQLPHTPFWADCITNTHAAHNRRVQSDTASLLAFKDIELMAKDQVLGH